MNFDLEIERHGDGYRARVINSASGEAEGSFQPPYDQAELKEMLGELDASTTRRISNPQLNLAKEIGARLHQSLFTAEIRRSFERAKDDAEREQAAGLRIRLHLDGAPDLAILPWEFLFDPDPRAGPPLAVAADTPLVRCLKKLQTRISPLRVKGPLRVLGIVSDPRDRRRYPPLNVNEEWRRLETALADPMRNELVELVRLPKATIRQLQDTLAVSEFHIVHFIGHGRFDKDQQDGVLAFEWDDGGVDEISAEKLGALLYSKRKNIRLVVLNACEGGRAAPTDPYAGMAQTLVRHGIPAVVAMQFEITDGAALELAQQFYAGIARGEPVDTALTQARLALFVGGNDIEWATPVLYMRAPDGQLFDIAPAPSVATKERSSETALPGTIEAEPALTIDELRQPLGHDLKAGPRTAHEPRTEVSLPELDAHPWVVDEKWQPGTDAEPGNKSTITDVADAAGPGSPSIPEVISTTVVADRHPGSVTWRVFHPGSWPAAAQVLASVALLGGGLLLATFRPGPEPSGSVVPTPAGATPSPVEASSAPAPTPRPPRPVTHKPYEVIMPPEEFPLLGYKVSFDGPVAVGEWRRQFLSSTSDLDWAEVWVGVGPASTTYSPVPCGSVSTGRTPTSRAELVVPALGERRAGCRFAFSSGDRLFLIQVESRNVYMEAWVHALVGAADGSAIDLAEKLAQRQLAIIDRVDPP